MNNISKTRWIYYFLKIEGILRNKSLKIHVDERKENFEEKNFPAQICFGH